MRRVFDLHADLLCYLAARPRRTPLQGTSRCALHQLRDGGVDLQVLPIFTLGRPGSTRNGLEQARWFAKLLGSWGGHYGAPYKMYATLADGAAESLDALLDPEAPPGEGHIRIIGAVENASSFCEPDEPLADGLARLDAFAALTGPMLYVSLTWRNENRFGGGDATQVGLHDDGRRLLEHLAERGIAVDLSHASDRLAEEILGFIDEEGLELVPVASHSNFRAVRPHPRNLPNVLAAEIVARGGVIGLNLVRGYVGEAVEALADHVAHGLERGWGRHLVLGSDFFWEGDLPSGGKLGRHHFFFPGFENASCHVPVQRLIEERLDPGDAVLRSLCSENARRFITSRPVPRMSDSHRKPTQI